MASALNARPPSATRARQRMNSPARQTGRNRQARTASTARPDAVISKTAPRDAALSPANSPMPYSAKKCPAQTSSPPSRIAHVRISGHADRATEQRTGQALDGGVAEEEHRQVDRKSTRLNSSH